MRASKAAIQRSRRVFTPEQKAAALQDGRTLRGEARTASADRARIAALEATIAKKDRVIAEVSEEYLDMKKVWGPMTARWVPPDRRDEVVDCVTSRSTRTTLPVRPLLQRLGITRWKFARWTTAYGAVPTPHGPVPRDHWLTRAEQDGILLFHEQHPLEGDRRLTYMLLDAGDIAVSPTSVYRVLQAAGRLDRSDAIWATRDGRLEAARAARQLAHHAVAA